MRESISYSFLLNTIILFIFICFAVIMGIFSYYRAFRANTIIINSIEKYEGFNCLAQEEAARKLSTLSYSTPFRANNRSDNIGELLTNSSEYNNLGYSVIYYDLNDRNYQYGVFTYMYMDLPIINQIMRIPLYSKTKVLYEFRELTNKVPDEIKSQVIDEDIHDRRDWVYQDDFELSKNEILVISAHLGAGYNQFIKNLTPRLYFKLDVDKNGLIDANDTTALGNDNVTTIYCGKVIDYNLF